MTIFGLYIFDRHCSCIFHKRWNNTLRLGDNSEQEISLDKGGLVGTCDMPFSEEAKLVYGVVFSLRNFMSKIAPRTTSETFQSFKTSTYKLTFYQTPSMLKFVLITSPEMATKVVKDSLVDMYSRFYVDYVVKNPTPNLIDEKTGFLQSKLFSEAIDRYIRNLPGYDL